MLSFILIYRFAFIDVHLSFNYNLVNRFKAAP